MRLVVDKLKRCRPGMSSGFLILIPDPVKTGLSNRFEWVEQPLKARLEDLSVVDGKLSVFVGVWYIDKYSNGLVPVNGSWSVSEMQVRRPIAARASHNDRDLLYSH